ncbi:MAG: hypothetical protein QOE07_2942 [Acidimicrobiaceae bacterium]|nr:hypothetical protein [Acidimicrobiaceae bacterium]
MGGAVGAVGAVAHVAAWRMSHNVVMANEEAKKQPADRHDQLAKLVLAGVVIALLVAFIVGNTQQVKVSFVFLHTRSRLIWVLLVTNLLGFVAGYLLHGRLAGRSRRKR